jgi:hypothetical protein
MPTIRNMVATMRDQGAVEVLQNGEVLVGDTGEGSACVKGQENGVRTVLG